MKPRTTALLALLGTQAACAAREIPSHLRVDDIQEEATTDADTLEALVARDPLLRRPPAGTEGRWASFGEPVTTWAALARRDAVDSRKWVELENRNRGTLAVPLARGARLALLEVEVSEELSPQTELAISEHLGHIRVADTDKSGPGAPLAWLATDSPRAAALHIAERRVLLGWLDSPALPLEAVAEVMKPGVHDRLMQAPAGQLILARAADRADEARGKAGRTALQRATLLALEQAAADRDSEQTSIADKLSQLKEEHGDRPIGGLLAEAREALIADASNDVSAGLALVAMTAERLRGTCPDAPCGGVDRTATLRAAERWGSEVASWARIWTLIQLKDAVDSFEVSHDKPTFYKTIPLLADALVRTDTGAVPLQLLQQRTANPVALLAISRASADVDATDLESTILALRKLLQQTAQDVLATDPPPEIAALVARIDKRAAKPPRLP